MTDDLATLRAECERLYGELQEARSRLHEDEYWRRKADVRAREVAMKLPDIIAALARVEALEAALREAKVWMVGDAPADVQQHIDGLLAAKPNTPATGGERRECY